MCLGWVPDPRVLCRELCLGLIALYWAGQEAGVLLPLFKIFFGEKAENLNILEIFASF